MLRDAAYDFENEAACRLAADCLIAPAVAQARRNMGFVNTNKKSRSSLPTTPIRHSRTEGLRKPLEIYLEYELRTEIKHPYTHETYIVSGRADWAGGYDGRAGSETVLFCAAAKHWGQAQAQLLTYLAICRHTRQVIGKPIPSVQGFSTDGCLYRFQHLSQDGTLYVSRVFDIRDEKEMKIAYNFIIHLVEAAIELSPTTTPSKGSTEDRTKAVVQYSDESFWGIFDPPPPPSSDDELPDDPPLDLSEYHLLNSNQLDSSCVGKSQFSWS